MHTNTRRGIMPFHRYRAFPKIELKDRTWPDKSIDAPPIWVSVDLRDGNQALIRPMDVETKLKFFDMLVQIGFKEIEVGFPASSEIEFEFVRRLIEEGRIPHDVTIQVLTQSRPELIEQTFVALRGARRAIVHLYNSTSTLQRRVVFNLDRKGVIGIATSGAKQIRDLAATQPETDWVFEYSPESFTGTELDFAVEICNAVTAIWKPTPARKAIINLPATVEMCRPNVYADMIEWMSRNLARRESIILSLHPHNDRGGAIVAAELGLLAGGERVEGTLLGNGERTGNVDIVTLALNMMSEGVDPMLDFRDIPKLRRICEECTNIEVHPRHPYAGDLSFTAFSGSHQDAIKKGTEDQERRNADFFEVPYFHIDPRDIGREYRPVRVNSQSGKAGAAYILLHDYKLDLPREIQIEFAGVVQRVTEETNAELSSADIWNLFRQEYLQRDNPLRLMEHWSGPGKKGSRHVRATIMFNGELIKVSADGNGEVNAFVNAIAPIVNLSIEVLTLHEHAVAMGSDASAISYVPIRVPGREYVGGVAMSTDTTKANLLAVVSAVNRVLGKK